MSKDFNFSDDGECIFAVVMVTYDIISDSMGIEPVGMYSSLKKALKYAAELEVYATKTILHQEERMFDVLEFRIDEEPPMLDLFKKRKLRLEEEVDHSIIKLMKSGVLDQLIGEDGNFYYVLTDKGKQKIEDMNLPKHIYKLFKKKDE
tara:strand:- start:6370 stop:6813 length:444 start_codon:yes stop_codon:yes gene_type:complete